MGQSALYRWSTSAPKLALFCLTGALLIAHPTQSLAQRGGTPPSPPVPTGGGTSGGVVKVNPVDIIKGIGSLFKKKKKKPVEQSKPATPPPEQVATPAPKPEPKVDPKPEAIAPAKPVAPIKVVTEAPRSRPVVVVPKPVPRLEVTPAKPKPKKLVVAPKPKPKIVTVQPPKRANTAMAERPKPIKQMVRPVIRKAAMIAPVAGAAAAAQSAPPAEKPISTLLPAPKAPPPIAPAEVARSEPTTPIATSSEPPVRSETRWAWLIGLGALLAAAGAAAKSYFFPKPKLACSLEQGESSFEAGEQPLIRAPEFDFNVSIDAGEPKSPANMQVAFV